MPSADELRKSLPRHERLPDVLGASSDPHPKKTHRLEWIGEPSPLDNPITEAMLLHKQFTPLQEQAVRKATAYAQTRGDGHRTRLLEHDHPGALAPIPGLSQTYIFSRANGYVQDVTYADIDVIMKWCPREFVDRDDPNASPTWRDLLPKEDEIFRLVRSEAETVEGRESGIIAKT